jgi:hypothetical protein
MGAVLQSKRFKVNTGNGTSAPMRVQKEVKWRTPRPYRLPKVEQHLVELLLWDELSRWQSFTQNALSLFEKFRRGHR